MISTTTFLIYWVTRLGIIKIQTNHGINSKIYSTTYQIFKLHAVKTRKVRSTYAPWLTTEIRCEMNTRDYLKKRAVKSNSKSLHRVYKAKRNEVNKLIRSAKFRYCKDNIDLNKHNPKQMWKNINRSSVF
jgi:hypothetical protein